MIILFLSEKFYYIHRIVIQLFFSNDIFNNYSNILLLSYPLLI